MSQPWLKFRCMYCGQLIRAPKSAQGQTGRCPRCKHTLRVLSPARKAILKSQFAPAKKPPLPEPPADRDLAESIAEQYKYLKSVAEPADVQAPPSGLVRWAKQIFLPVYNELSLFLMSVTAIILLFSSRQLRAELVSFARMDLRAYIMFFFAAAGIVFSIYHIFSNRPMRVYQLKAMLFFAVLANASSAIMAGKYMLHQSSNRFLMIFPVLNIADGIYLLLLLRFGGLTIRSITGEKASFLQVVVGTVTALTVFLVAHFVFRFYWAVTFSICVTYATGFSRAVQELLCPVERELDRFT
jgi:DNA-directed RNA polymerase subunit RPC12/RpoP